MENTQVRQSFFTGRQIIGIVICVVGGVLVLIYFIERRPSQHGDWVETTCVVDAYRTVPVGVTLANGRIAQEYRGEYTKSYSVDQRGYSRKIDAGLTDSDAQRFCHPPERV